MIKLRVNKDNVIIEVLLFCLLIYFSQGPVLPTGTIISQLALSIIILISFYFMLVVLTLKVKHPLFIWAWFLLIAINIIGYILTFDIIDSNYMDLMKTILISTLPFYPFYFFSTKKRLLKSHLIRFFLIMLFLAILQFYYNEENFLSALIDDDQNLVNNTGYYFVLLLPYTFLFKRKLLSYLSIFIILVFIIQSAKRGALIVSLSGSILFLYYQVFLQSSKNFIRNITFTTITLTSIILYLYNYFLSNDYLLTRLNQIDEGGSGRTIIYSNLLESWYNSNNIFNFIFGYGFRSSVNYSGTGNLAHNDWLEMLISFGLLGFVIYLFIFISLIYSIFSKNINMNSRVILICIITMWFLISLISMFYLSITSVFIIILLAYILGSNKANS